MWDKIKGMLIEDDDPQAAAPPQQPAQPAPKPPGNGTAHVGGSMPSFTPMLNQDMVAAIRKATFSRNTPLTTLIAQSDNFADVIPDPVMRLKAAHKASGGRSSKEIADAVAIHLNDVDGEERRFAQALGTQVQSEVGGLTRQAEQCEQQAAAMSNEINQLSQRIAQLQTSAAELSGKSVVLRGEAQAKEHSLRQAEVEFKAAAQAVRDELNGHKNTIMSTLG